MINKFEAEGILKKYKQQHLLNHFDKLSETMQKKLLNQIESLDFELITNLYENTNKNKEEQAEKIDPIEYYDKKKLYDKYDDYKQTGRKAIKQGKLAVVTMAGGQGTRLGFNGPKGAFDIGLNSHKSLFELLCDHLKRANAKYQVTIPWFIMTSEENNDKTIEFFEKHNYFGYKKDQNIFFFKQGQLPMIDTEGKILLNEEGLIKLAADGHGGVYKALIDNKMLDKMKQMKIEWIFVGGIDNCLAKMADPLFVGMAIDKQVSIAAKSVAKKDPSENVGVFCRRNGKPSIIEYSEISEEMANARDENGELLYGESNILCNLFKIDIIEEIAETPLPYHVAYKKANYMDENGNIVEPSSPNAYKFEAFIFDAFTKVDNMLVLRVKREDEFAPVKNNDQAGEDCPSTARELYENYHKNKKGGNANERL